jgi:hypothetical protein
MTGILRISNGDSRISGTLLGRKGDGDPYGAATSFLEENDCHDSDCVTVTGNQEADAFYLDSAVKEAASKCKPTLAMAVTEDLGKGTIARKARKKSSNSKARKSAKKRAGKKAPAPQKGAKVSQRAKTAKRTSVNKGRTGRKK